MPIGTEKLERIQSLCCGMSNAAFAYDIKRVHKYANNLNKIFKGEIDFYKQKMDEAERNETENHAHFKTVHDELQEKYHMFQVFFFEKLEREFPERIINGAGTDNIGLLKKLQGFFVGEKQVDSYDPRKVSFDQIKTTMWGASVSDFCDVAVKADVKMSSEKAAPPLDEKPVAPVIQFERRRTLSVSMTKSSKKSALKLELESAQQACQALINVKGPWGKEQIIALSTLMSKMQAEVTQAHKEHKKSNAVLNKTAGRAKDFLSKHLSGVDAQGKTEEWRKVKAVQEKFEQLFRAHASKSSLSEAEANALKVVLGELNQALQEYQAFIEDKAVADALKKVELSDNELQAKNPFNADPGEGLRSAMFHDIMHRALNEVGYKGVSREVLMDSGACLKAGPTDVREANANLERKAAEIYQARAERFHLSGESKVLPGLMDKAKSRDDRREIIAGIIQLQREALAHFEKDSSGYGDVPDWKTVLTLMKNEIEQSFKTITKAGLKSALGKDKKSGFKDPVIKAIEDLQQSLTRQRVSACSQQFAQLDKAMQTYQAYLMVDPLKARYQDERSNTKSLSSRIGSSKPHK